MTFLYDPNEEKIIDQIFSVTDYDGKDSESILEVRVRETNLAFTHVRFRIGSDYAIFITTLRGLAHFMKLMFKLHTYMIKNYSSYSDYFSTRSVE